MKIFSVDAETNGLYGDPIAIAVAVLETEIVPTRGGERSFWKTKELFTARTHDEFATDPWVKQHVLPVLDKEVTHDSPFTLREAFWSFWLKHRGAGAKPECTVIAHVAYPVETNLFRECVMHDEEKRRFMGPYPGIHDVDTLLLLNGEPEGSVDAYLKKVMGSELAKTMFGNLSPHNPMYDAQAAAWAWTQLWDNTRQRLFR